MFRKRRSPILKLLLGFGITWMFLLLIVVLLNVADIEIQEYDNSMNNLGKVLAGGVADGPNTPPVIERLDLDRLRFQEAMQFAIKNPSEKFEHKVDTKLANGFIQSVKDTFRQLTSGQENISISSKDVIGMRGVDDIMIKLIDQGLVVPKWHLQKEPLANSGKMTGENGQGIVIVKEKLSAEERKKFDEGYKNNAFNEYASNIMSLHRSLPDVRDPECRSISYRKELPDASVIIIFHNEANTVLLRTVHSVLDRSPPHLLKEIILVDDFSSFDHLKQPLEDYIKQLSKVRVVRGKKREGLIRARLLGASVASAKVLIFLDSHCECTLGWMEPLLDRIAENWTNVVTPIIDVLNDDTLKYGPSSARYTQVGGFDWNLVFNWHPIPAWERKKHKSIVDPVWSPTMAGGLFGIDRNYFEYLGAYDPGMDIWGGENLELSFKIWMCGGTLEQVLCSHVGHIFRKRSPYKWITGKNVVRRNSVRLAEVWLDEYSKFYYERFNFELGEYGDVSARKELRKRLKCKSFDWYIKNIFPELFIPGEAVASGEIRCKALGTFSGGRKQAACIDSPSDKKSLNKPIKIWPCHLQGGNQHWLLSKTGEIRRDEGCIDYTGKSLLIFKCHGAQGNQHWSYEKNGIIRHVITKKCLTLSENGTGVEVLPCTGIDRQIWQWRRKDATNSTITTRLTAR